MSNFILLSFDFWGSQCVWGTKVANVRSEECYRSHGHNASQSYISSFFFLGYFLHSIFLDAFVSSFLNVCKLSWFIDACVAPLAHQNVRRKFMNRLYVLFLSFSVSHSLSTQHGQPKSLLFSTRVVHFFVAQARWTLLNRASWIYFDIVRTSS